MNSQSIQHPKTNPQSLISFIFSCRKKLYVGILYGFARALALTPIPILFRSIVDQHVADSNVTGVFSTAAIFLGLIFLNFTFMTLSTRHLAAATIAIGAELRARVFEKMQFLSFGYPNTRMTPSKSGV
jgi:ABC-type multidrug transport system fused ATPase/permease subunit